MHRLTPIQVKNTRILCGLVISEKLTQEQQAQQRNYSWQFFFWTAPSLVIGG